MANKPPSRAEFYMQERKQGKTYREIAKKYGVTHQAVAAACAIHMPGHFKPYTEKEVIYPKLRKWLNDNEVSRNEFARRMGLVPYAKNSYRVSDYFRGKNYPLKETIDKMLQVTGLTYEELFSLEE